MKMRIIIILILLFIVFNSCQEVVVHSEIPKVEFISYELIDTIDHPDLGNQVLKGSLRFYFVDGDGDIGFEESQDTTKEDKKTVFVSRYKKENGIFKLEELNLDLEYNVPYFSTTGNNLTLEGEIIIDHLNIYNPNREDTIMYKFYIMDRAGNKSNVDSTGSVAITDYF